MFLRLRRLLCRRRHGRRYLVREINILGPEVREVCCSCGVVHWTRDRQWSRDVAIESALDPIRKRRQTKP